ncbi:divalent metal cation transporter [Humibacillus xanthopallidus]|uniref:divalent metal cation transporter n=1 Tax=Humibacillus xanthopallidus TaxID=412689 RepID=UPI0021AB392D|nr:divalent metal cation transporter [Humibacillus xanthopallidus]
MLALLDHEAPGVVQRQLSGGHDVATGMTVSVVVMFAIMLTTSATIGRHPTDINSAADAAQAPRPVAGPLEGMVFALGFIGTGLLGVPVLASAACIGMSGLTGKSWGFDRSIRKAPLFYGLLAVSLTLGPVLAAVLNDAIAMLVLSATITDISAAPFLAVVLLVASDRRIMKDRTNGALATHTVGWLTAVVMAARGVIAIAAQFIGP